ncbi:MAG: SMP-30/gluconolactonase/LRE family protein [Pseudomonadota bacterium]
MRRIILISFAVLCVAFGYRVLSGVIPASGAFTDFETIAVDQCRRVEVAPGPEDIEIDHATGIAFISSAQRRNPERRERGGLYSLDLNTPDARPISLLGDTPVDFSPHGLSLWNGTDGTRRLFVINHPAGAETVEIFDILTDGTLNHLETVSFDAMYSPNDVVAVGARRFYASNDRRYREGLGQMLELYLGLPLADIVYFDGEVGREVADSFSYANGINVSADGSKLYVAEVIGRQINIFDRDLQTGEVSNRRHFKVGTAPDNIDIGTDGNLYIGSHPNLLAFVKHAENADENSPSQVVRMNPETGETETVFMAVNGEINGSATGPYWNGHMLVGGVFDSQIMWCTDILSAGDS